MPPKRGESRCWSGESALLAPLRRRRPLSPRRGNKEGAVSASSTPPNAPPLRQAGTILPPMPPGMGVYGKSYAPCADAFAESSSCTSRSLRFRSDLSRFAVFASLLITVASFMPSMQNADDYTSKPSSKPYGIFTPEAELTNGRAAIVGLLTVTIVEKIMGHGFFA